MSSEDLRRVDAAEFMGARDESIARAQRATQSSMHKRLIPVSSKLAATDASDGFFQDDDAPLDTTSADAAAPSAEPTRPPDEAHASPTEPDASQAVATSSSDSCLRTLMIVAVVISLVGLLAWLVSRKKPSVVASGIPIDYEDAHSVAGSEKGLAPPPPLQRDDRFMHELFMRP